MYPCEDQNIPIIWN